MDKLAAALHALDRVPMHVWLVFCLFLVIAGIGWLFDQFLRADAGSDDPDDDRYKSEFL